MTDLAIPSALNGLQFRAAVIEDIDVKKRELYVRAVPYEMPADIGGGITEVFSRGAFKAAAKAPDRLAVYYGHKGPLVGRATEVVDTADGSWIRSRIGKTANADEMLELIEDKILTDPSIEFNPIPADMIVAPKPGGGYQVRHRRGHLTAFAMVPDGAFAPGAFVASVREAEAERKREEALAWFAAFKGSTA